MLLFPPFLHALIISIYIDNPNLQVPVLKSMELMVEASPRRVFANAHTYHINSISVNSDQETYLSADDLRINLWNLEITDQSFSILYVYIYCVFVLLNNYCINNLIIKKLTHFVGNYFYFLCRVYFS